MQRLSRAKEYMIDTTLFNCYKVADVGVRVSLIPVVFSILLHAVDTSFKLLQMENKFYKIEPKNENIVLLGGFFGCCCFCFDAIRGHLNNSIKARDAASHKAEWVPDASDQGIARSSAPQQPQMDLSGLLIAPGISVNESSPGLNFTPTPELRGLIKET